MNKTLSIIFLLIFTTPLFSQIDSTKVSFTAYWAKGDNYDFKVTKIKKSWTNDKISKIDSTQYIANFKILDSTEKSYTIQWSYKNQLIDTYKESLNNIYKDKKAVSDIVKKYDVTKIIYKTDEYGEFIEIINWQEISGLMGDMLNELEKSFQTRNPDKKKQVEKVLAPLTQIYSSKEGIEQLLLYELQYFHFPFGSEYDVNIPFEYEQEFPNMLGGDPIKGKAKLSIEEVDFKDFYCVLKEEVVVNPDDTKRQVILLLKKMGISGEKADKIMKTAIFDISDLNYYQYYFDPGIPHRLYGRRKVILNMEKTNAKNIEEIFIELVYKE